MIWRRIGMSIGDPRSKDQNMPASDGIFDGIVAVPATPFTADDRVDVESLRRYARGALRQGAAGFLAPAVAGEVDTLSDQERETIVATLIEEAGGRVPVIGGATDPDPVGRVRHAARFIEMGCAGVLAYIRYEDEKSYANHVHALGNLEPGFLMIQDLDRGTAPLPVPLIARLHRDVPSFRWIKVETSDRCRKCTAILEATGGTMRLGTAGPDLIELLDRGIHSYLSTFTTGVYHRIWTLHRSGHRTEANTLYHRLLPCLAFMTTHQNIQWRFTKDLLHAEGVFTTARIRTPAPELDAVEARLVDELAAQSRELAASMA